MQVKELFKEFYETRDVNLRNQLVEDHLYMVEILVRKYLNKGIEYDDLYQVGAMALISAVERFDPTKGFEFSSFATPTILGEIKKHFRDKGWALKVPRRMKELASAITRAKTQLTNDLGRNPTVKEIAEFLEEPEDQVFRALESSFAYNALSLNQVFEEDDENSNPMFEKYASEEEEGYEEADNNEVIENVLEKLSGTDRYIFKKRFIESRSQGEIAKDLGVSQMTVSRAEKKIIEKFAKEMAV